jgi:glucose/arabinose dehydrogenase
MRVLAPLPVALGICAAAFICAFAVHARAQVASSEQDSVGEWGAHPTIPGPTKSLLPTVNVATAEGWPAGMMPHAPKGAQVDAFATGLDHPRWLYVLPNGDVLVAEADTPPKPEDAKGLSGAIHKHVMKTAGSGRAPSANRITLLRDVGAAGTPRAGEPPERHILLQGLNSPIGMALIGDRLYVANTDALVSFPYHTGQTEIRDAPTQVTVLPGGPINHHWTKSLIANREGTKLYVGVGSNSNAAENGLAAEQERAAVWEINPKTARIEFMHQACAIRSVLPGSRRTVCCGSRSTSAMSSAITCRLTT